MQPWKSLSANVQVGTLIDGWTLATPPTENHDQPRVFRCAVHFSAPFTAPPVVHLGCSALTSTSVMPAG